MKCLLAPLVFKVREDGEDATEQMKLEKVV